MVKVVHDTLVLPYTFSPKKVVIFMKLKKLRQTHAELWRKLLAGPAPEELESLSNELQVVGDAIARHLVSRRRSLWHARWWLLVLILSLSPTVCALVA